MKNLFQFCSQKVRAVVLLCALTMGMSGIVIGDVELPNVFSDHMVLQRDQPNRVWGHGAAGEKVTVAIAGQSHQASCDDAGNWSVTLKPLAVGGPHEMTVTGKNIIKISDILVGEVWICSGQSNMEWAVNNSNDADLEQLTAKHPAIRMINFPNVGSQEPVWTHGNSSWMVCSPETVGQFSAVGYFFGRQLHETLDVPIGLVNNSWGGSACDSWIDRKLIDGDNRFDGLSKRWVDAEANIEKLAAMKNRTEEQEKQLNQMRGQMTGNQRPGNLYNGILKSHLGYGIRGAIWYQGESNAGRAYQYRDLFPLMIESWRKEWGQGDFPFYWVQLADFKQQVVDPSESDWAELREAQTMTLDRVPNSGQAVIIDIGEGRDIHPKNKVDVGRRLARIALARDYGVQIASQSPRFQEMKIEGDKAVLTFKDVNRGWRPFDINAPVGFVIAGEDKVFKSALAKVLEDGRIEVWHPDLKNPVAVRYAWADNPVCNMYDGAGLPLTPFRTDDWPGVTANNQ